MDSNIDEECWGIIVTEVGELWERRELERGGGRFQRRGQDSEDADDTAAAAVSRAVPWYSLARVRPTARRVQRVWYDSSGAQG